MGIDCGTACMNCDLPIRLDTYEGCSHGCRYCFNRKHRDISQIKPNNCVKQLENFINGARSKTTNWCDWKIPLHWGGNSDPFQPCEARYGISYNCLKVFAKTQYPFVVSTKGKIIATPKYLDVLKECDGVIQISLASPKYDQWEPGAPTFEERLKVIEKVQPNCKRVIVRFQPYVPDIRKDVLEELQTLANIGVYGVTFSGMDFKKKGKGLVRNGDIWNYPLALLKNDYLAFKDKAHEVGLHFYCGEPGLKHLGDDFCCCGVSDLYETNKVTFERYANGEEMNFSPAQLKKGTAQCFRAIKADSKFGDLCDASSFAEMFYIMVKGSV